MNSIPGYENIVADAWRKRNTAATTNTVSESNSNDLDIPTFLRKNKMGNK